MIQLFSEKVKPTFTNSGLNILQIENFEEIFFDVFALEINNKQFTTEKINQYRGHPVVNVFVVKDGKKAQIPFVLKRGPFKVIFNEKNQYDFSDTNPEIDEELLPIAETEIIDNSISEEVLELKQSEEELVQKIEEAKANAKRSLLKEIERKHVKQAQLLQSLNKEKTVELQKLLEKAKQELIGNFLTITEDIGSKQSDFKQEIEAEFKRIEEQFSITCKKIPFDVKKQIFKYFKEEIEPLIERVSTEKIKFNTSRIKQNLVQLVKDNALNERTIIQEIIELKNEFQRGLNKALSRIGNVKTNSEAEIQKVNDTIKSVIDDVLTIAEQKIEQYYQNNITIVETKFDQKNEAIKQELIDLIGESKSLILGEIKNNTITPFLYTEAKGLKKSVNVEQLKKDLQKDIESKFSNELRNLRRIIELSAGGGSGSVAVQFARGGTMRGDLIVNGTITVNENSNISNSDNWSSVWTTVCNNSAAWTSGTPAMCLPYIYGGGICGITPVAGTNTTDCTYSNIAGGDQNQAMAPYTNIAGGGCNKVLGNYSNVAGGAHNCVEGKYANVGGGNGNYASGDYAIIGGGYCGYAKGNHSVVVGGQNNSAEGNYSIIGGGSGNYVSGNYSGILGGVENYNLHNHSFIIGSGLTSNADYTLFTNNIYTSGNLVVTGEISATSFKATSATFTVIDITQYELSGYNIQGNATIQGDVSASNIIYANGGDSNMWNAAYTTVHDISATINDKTAALYAYLIQNFDQNIVANSTTINQFVATEWSPSLGLVPGDTITLSAANAVYVLSNSDGSGVNDYFEVNLKPNFLFYKTGMENYESLDSFPLSAMKSAKYVLEVEDKSTADIFYAELNVVSNGVIATATEYGSNYTTDLPFVEFGALFLDQNVHIYAIGLESHDINDFIFKGNRTNLF